MGKYNPYLPQDLGNEWVPIRNEDLILNPFANTLERGYSFTLPTATAVNNVRFYINEFPPLFVRNQAYTASIYKRGQEDQSGPVNSVIIPCNAGAITGTGGIVTSPSTSTVPEVVYNPSANYFINWTIGNGNDARANFFFATNSYAQLLNGKRILGVNLLTGINVTVAATADPDQFAATAGQLTPYLANDAFNADFPLLTNGFVIYRPLVTLQTPADTRLLVRTKMGDADVAYGTTGGLTAATPNISQWTYSELQRFEASASNRLFILLNSGSLSGATGATVLILYMALEVFYCEERRLAFGTRNINGLRIVQARDPFQLGMNQIIVRDTSGTANPTLSAGDYTVTLSEANTGDDFNVAFSPFQTAKVNEIRQLYQIPTLPGVQVNLPFPLNEEAIGSTLTQESTDFIPQLSLHTSAGTVFPESHGYGRQSIGQVWGNNFVTQDIDDSNLPSLLSYPQVRYWARRFGDTSVPLKLSSASPLVSGAGVSVQITPAEFDLLDEILDGWKEVDLRFTTAPQMGGSTFPTWKWTATGELPGSRWEVLGASAYAASGIAQQMPINLQFGQVPPAQQLYLSTYGAPVSGGQINEEWLPQLGPYVSGAAVDQSADVSIIFAQDMLPITGFGVSVLSQAVTGIGQRCGIDPCGIPNRILYNQLRWGLPVNTGIAQDSFTRVVVNGFGSADRGGAYSLTATAAEYAVNGSAGVVTPIAASVNTFATLSNIANNVDMTVIASISSATGAIIAGTSVRAHLVARFTDLNNYYGAFIQTNPTTGVSIVALEKNVAGVGSILGTADITRGIDNGNKLKLRFLVQGPYLKVKAWSPFLPEPSGWQLEITDSTLPNGTGAGVGGQSRTLVGNSIVLDDFTVGPPNYTFGYYEMQRMDSITEWKTIMKATNPAVTGFIDYEARIGMSSSYRIRGVDIREFAGPWSSTVSVSIISPGVSGSCLSQAHILTFTTNERQNGSSNLAYSNAWEGTVTEDFTFPEASFTQLQPMYNRDFFTAFRPLERGGEDFSRTLLVQAAAIAPPTLGDFRSLRDMAWEEVSYICVRDEDGNRWFANVNVPSGVVQNRRRLYMATVQIVEVTSTPTPVNP